LVAALIGVDFKNLVNDVGDLPAIRAAQIILRKLKDQLRLARGTILD